MQGRHRRIADLDRQIAARYHDAVADAQDFFQVGNRLGAFNFGNQARLVFVLRRSNIAQLAGHFHVRRVFGETHRHVVGLKAHRGLDVLHVLGRQRGCRQAAALLVDALVVGQLAAELDGGDDFFTQHRIHRQHDQAVIEQQRVARLDIARQLLVVQSHTLDVARLGARGVQHELLARHQLHLALGKLAHADFGSLQIGHDGDLAPSPLRGFADQGGKLDMVLRPAVAEVQAHHIDAGTNHILEHRGVAGCRAQGGNNLRGATCHAESPCSVFLIFTRLGRLLRDLTGHAPARFMTREKVRTRF